MKNFFKSQSFKNSFWSLLSTGSYPVLLLVATPLFLSKLGDRQYGVWILINTILQMMGSVNFGLGDSSIKFISESQAQGSSDRTQWVVSILVTLSILVASSISIIGILAIYLVDVYSLVSIEPHLLFCLRISIFLFVLKFFEVSLLSIYQGFKRYDLAARWSVGSRLMALLINIAVVIGGNSLAEIFLSALVTQFFFLVLLVFSIKRRFEFLSLIPNFSLKGARVFLSFGLWSWIQNMLAVFTTQVDKLIVASTAGLQTLTYYSLGSMIALQFHSIFVSSSSWIFPVVSERVARKESLVDFYLNAQALLVLFGLTLLISFLFLQDYILMLWLGRVASEQASDYVSVFIYYDFFLILMIIPYFFLNGSGNIKQNTLSELILKMANILFMIVFFYLMGTVGLVWGIVISTAMVAPYKISQAYRYVLLKKSAFFSIDSILCAILLIAFFQLHNTYLRMVCFTSFSICLYFVFLKKMSLDKLLKFGVEKS